MIDIVSATVQVLPVSLVFGALLVLARAQREKTKPTQKQPVPIRVERDPREG